MRDAITLGYRHFDSAEAYRNEIEVGNAVSAAIQQGLVSRKELFLATKISDAAHGGHHGVQALVKEQLKHFQTDYIDLYMLHSPMNDKVQQETWKGLEELYDQGIIKALGVSNFNGKELKKLISSSRIKPMVVQNKLDIYHVGKQLDNMGDDIVAVTREHGIVLVAYSSFSAYPFVLKPADDPIIRYIAGLRNQAAESASKSASSSTTGTTTPPVTPSAVTPSQVILRYVVQNGFAAIPRSSKATHLQENLRALDMTPLTQQEMNLIASTQYLTSSPVSKAVAI